MRLPKDHQRITTDKTLLNEYIKGGSKVGRKKTGKDVICIGCGISFYIRLSKILENGNYHSAECFKQYCRNKKNNKIELPWSRAVYKKNSGDNNHNYKDLMVSESALHKWVRCRKGSPESCVDCGITKDKEKFLDWSNVSGLYFRDLNDFVGRCRSCHKAYDTKLGFSRKKSFNEKGQRIGITLILPVEYSRSWNSQK